MAKLRKMLGSAEAPETLALMRLIETQSRETLTSWSVDYVKENVLPVYEKEYPQDKRPRAAVEAAQQWLLGALKKEDVKKAAAEATAAAKEAEKQPAQSAAARAAATAVMTVNTPANALGFTFYTAAAIVYDREGLAQKPQVYDAAATEEFKKLVKSLQERAVEHEPDPVRVKWHC